MDILESKNRLALETARLIFQNRIGVIFIGGTALNTFYLDYRYSEDLDLAYPKKNPKSDIEALLQKYGYTVSKTNFAFRDVISLEGLSIKLDIVEYQKKYTGPTEKLFDGVSVKTLPLEEFAVEKTISFFTREDLVGIGRDAYDLFVIRQKYPSLLSLIRKTKPIIRKHVSNVDHNLQQFESRLGDVENLVRPYLKKPVAAARVLTFLKSVRGVLRA